MSDEKNVYLDGMLKALPIGKQCLCNNKIQIFHIQLKIGYKSYVKLFIKMIHGMSDPTQAHLYVTQINSQRFNFMGIVELTVYLRFLKTGLKLKF